MARDYTNYTIAQLQESINVVDGNRFPENKAALEAELKSRIQSGGLAREAAEQEVVKKEIAAEQEIVRKEKAISAKGFAKKARVVIAWYLILSPIVILYQISLNVSGPSIWVVAMIIAPMAAFLMISHWAGIGLLKGKTWAHWAALAVLASQLVRIQSDAIILQFLSLVGVYITIDEDISIGILALFAPGIQLSFANDVHFELGLNVLIAPLIRFLIIAREGVE